MGIELDKSDEQKSSQPSKGKTVTKRRLAFPRLGDVLSYDDGRFIKDIGRRQTYNKHRTALVNYANGEQVQQIASSLGISRQWLHQLAQRHEKIGRNALLRYSHSGDRNPNIELLTSSCPKPNQLGAFWKKYPNIEHTLRRAAISNKLPDERNSKGALAPVALLALLYEELEKVQRSERVGEAGTGTGAEPDGGEGLKVNGGDAPEGAEFPATSPDRGLRALTRWAAAIRADAEAAERQRNLIKRAAREAMFPRDPPGEFYFRVDCDGHWIDVNWMIECLSPSGTGLVKIHVKRLWFLPMIEERSGTILGYAVAFGENYGAEDICRAANSALIPWKPRQLSIPKMAYRAGECLPNALMPELLYICWDELHVDNAKAHLADIFLCALEHDVGCVINFGPAATPNARPKIEKIFHLLEEAGFHKIPATTGSNPDDPLGDAVTGKRYDIKLEVLLDLIDLLACRWNAASPPDSNESRLSILRRHVQNPNAIVRRVPLEQRNRIEKYDLTVPLHIGTKNRRPIVRWDGVEYDGPGLSASGRMVGQEILGLANSQDPRKIEAILQSTGESLGILEVEARYRDTVHSVATRKFAKSISKHNRFSSKTGDLILAARREAIRNHLDAPNRSGAAAARAIHEQIGSPRRTEFDADRNISKPAASSNLGSISPTADRDTGQELARTALTEEQRRQLAKLGATY